MIDEEYVKQLESRLELVEKDREEIRQELIAAYDASKMDSILLLSFNVLSHSNNKKCLEICDMIETHLKDLKHMSGMEIQRELTDLLSSYPELVQILMTIATYQRNLLEISRKAREYALSNK